MFLAAAFGVATLGLAAFNLRIGAAARFAGLLLLAVWLICMTTWIAAGADLTRVVGYTVDIAAGLLCIAVWLVADRWNAPCGWLIVLALLFAAQLYGHGAYDLGWWNPRLRLQVYLGQTNVLQLVTVAIGPRPDVLKRLGRFSGRLTDGLLPHPGIRYRRRCSAQAASRRRQRV